MTDIRDQLISLQGWKGFIDQIGDEPIMNVADNGAGVYDAIFVGGGGGGRFGAAYLKAMGGRPLIVDRWPFLGGSCPHQACFPHHLFSDVAIELDLWKHLSGELFFPSWDSSRARILDVVTMFRNGRNAAHALMNYQTKEQLDVEYVLNAAATVIDPNTVEVAGQRFSCRNVVLGMGTQPYRPDIPGVNLPGVFDYASLIEDLDYEPTRCVVIGGSKTGIEYSSFFNTTGCPTTLVSRSHIMKTKSLQHVDEELRTYVVEGMRGRGMEIIEGAAPIGITGELRADGVDIQLTDGSRLHLEADFVFLGTGETPYTSLAREWLGVELGLSGEILVDRCMRTSVPNVYAIGDSIGAPMEIFKARKSGVVAARNIMGEAIESDWDEYPDFLHTTYEVAWVGLTEDEARETYDDVIVIQFPPKGVAPEDVPVPIGERSMIFAFARPELSGFSKCVIDGGSRRVVGMHHVGFGVKDAFQYIDFLMRRPEGLTIDDMASMNELFLNSEQFIQLCRLRAGARQLESL